MPASSLRRFPLHLHISAMFTFLLLLTGVILGLFNYHQTSEIILSSSNKLFERIQQDVEQDLHATYQPIRQLLALLASLPAADINDPVQRRQVLVTFAQALRDNPDLASLYLGFNNGDFLMVRPLPTAALRHYFSAPDNAAYQAWQIHRSASNEVHSESVYYDQALQVISTLDNPAEHYDPRDRVWFKSASGEAGQITTAPYLFFSTHNVGTTLALRDGNEGVIGADLTLAALSATLVKHRITPATEVVLFDPDGNAVAYPDSARLIVESGTARLARAADLSAPLKALLSKASPTDGRMRLAGREWVVARSTLHEGGPEGLRLALLVPEDELLSDAYRIRWQGALITLSILLLCLPLGWLTSRILVRPLEGLVREAEAIRSFNFQYPPSRPSPVLEIDQLRVSMLRMKETLASFLEISASLSAETRYEFLLQRVLQETVRIGEAQAGLLYLIDRESDKHQTRLEPCELIIGGARLDPKDYGVGAHTLANGAVADERIPAWLRPLIRGVSSTVQELGFEEAGDLQPILRDLDSPRAHLVAIRLHNRQGESIGVLVLLHSDSGNNNDLRKMTADRIAFIQAVSGSAALCIESQRLQVRQKRLLDAFIQLLAGAIDAKSPYTGGHCQRVPELTFMLARAAADSNEPAFSSYQPNEDEWEALHIAAWLHDCGKVTTPEYVVDKATKLETLYDRIHEIRTRFEVLKRDVWIDYWQQRASGADDNDLARQRDQQLAALDDDFAFIARCNLGGEAMADADLDRLGVVAERTWLRTLDDRLGVSWEEQQRQSQTPPVPLPAREKLLADKPEHLFARPVGEHIAEDNPYGFQLDEPTWKFNRGEHYNLAIGRGTLTAEERYLINLHMVQTIVMLERLPFPGHLQQVPEIAGGHHEKMDGTGYPKRLKRDEMSLPARMMAIADIFEALTAADRPYKKGKSLGEALGIMAGMCRGAHIDPELFELFVRAGVYRQYAERFLQAAQIDSIDVETLLAKAGLGKA